MKEFLPTSRSAPRRDSGQRAGDIFTASDTRAQQLKKQMAAASAAADANTARLRALRLEKERQDAEAGGPGATEAKKARTKSARRVVD